MIPSPAFCFGAGVNQKGPHLFPLLAGTNTVPSAPGVTVLVCRTMAGFSSSRDRDFQGMSFQAPFIRYLLEYLKLYQRYAFPLHVNQWSYFLELSRYEFSC